MPIFKRNCGIISMIQDEQMSLAMTKHEDTSLKMHWAIFSMAGEARTGLGKKSELLKFYQGWLSTLQCVLGE